MLRRVEKMLYDFPFPPDIEAADGKKIKWNHPDFSIISSHKRTDGSMETFAIKQYAVFSLRKCIFAKLHCVFLCHLKNLRNPFANQAFFLAT